MSKIANGEDIVAAAIAWRNADNAYFDAIRRSVFGSDERTALQVAERKAWRKFTTLLDTRSEVQR